MPEIVYLSAGAFIGEMLEHVQWNRYCHFFHGLGFLTVFDVGLDELRSRHGIRYALVTPGQKLLPERFAVNRFVRGDKRVRADVATLCDARLQPRQTYRTDRENFIWKSIHPYTYRANTRSYMHSDCDVYTQHQQIRGLQPYCTRCNISCICVFVYIYVHASEFD